jgi:hypothetical protein
MIGFCCSVVGNKLWSQQQCKGCFLSFAFKRKAVTRHIKLFKIVAGQHTTNKQETSSTNPLERTVDTEQAQERKDLYQLWRPTGEELFRQYRIPFGLTNEQLVEKLQLLSESIEDKTMFVWINRDLFGYRFLFWLTGITMKEKQDGDVQTAMKLESLRDWIIESVAKIDRFLVRRVKQAEEKLKGLIQDYSSFKASPEKALGRIVGQYEMDYVCLWVVVYTAVIAWKLRAARSESPVSHPSSLVVSECRRIMEQKEFFQRKTPNGLKIVAQLFDQSVEEINPRLKELGNVDIQELGRLMTILELLPADPYRLLCRIACNLYDGAILLQYGVENYQIGSVRFGLDPYSFDSESRIPKLNNPFISSG